ncbi:BCD family MFS transporter [Aquisediminimonas profunda]|uniref:BCD family MFS transporter n=1 Tax=Aquisediminimonas profunda TaxID=1550733 RepID=UPI001C626C81|nr:BCD family MFS transporter [Aquisediminimonas profunda]
MSGSRKPLALQWARIGTAFLPFADAASAELPLSRLLRLSLFQISVGLAAVLLTGTLNRVMILELHIPAWTVALMVSIPLLFAPFRALIGHKSDTHKSVLGWRRVPYLWFGTLLQFGGFAILPFALIIMSGDTRGPIWYGEIAAALAFFLVGIGMHTTQTAGLALATDLATEETRPRVVALLYVMLLLGMLIASLLFGALLADFSSKRLIQVIQGTAELTLVLNVIALWKQEARNSAKTALDNVHLTFSQTWQKFAAEGRTIRLLVAVGLGSAAFSMQDVLLEPYGGQVLGLSVGQTTGLTALWATGALCGFGFAANQLGKGADPHRLAGIGTVAGIAAFSLVIFSAPLQSISVMRAGVVLIGFGSGVFSVGLLIAAMALSQSNDSGLALGAWGAVQASANGVAAMLGGGLRDLTGSIATRGGFGEALSGPATGYQFVYHVEIALLFATLVALGPLARRVTTGPTSNNAPKFGLTEFPT